MLSKPLSFSSGLTSFTEMSFSFSSVINCIVISRMTSIFASLSSTIINGSSKYSVHSNRAAPPFTIFPFLFFIASFHLESLVSTLFTSLQKHFFYSFRNALLLFDSTSNPLDIFHFVLHITLLLSTFFMCVGLPILPPLFKCSLFLLYYFLNFRTPQFKPSAQTSSNISLTTHYTGSPFYCTLQDHSFFFYILFSLMTCTLILFLFALETLFIFLFLSVLPLSPPFPCILLIFLSTLPQPSISFLLINDLKYHAA